MLLMRVRRNNVDSVYFLDKYAFCLHYGHFADGMKAWPHLEVAVSKQ